MCILSRFSREFCAFRHTFPETDPIIQHQPEKNSQTLSQDVVWLSVYGSAFLFPEPVRDFQQMVQPRQHCLESGKIRHAPLPVGVAAGAGGIDPGIRVQ